MRSLILLPLLFAGLCCHAQTDGVATEASYKIFKGSAKYDEAFATKVERTSLKDLVATIADKTGLKLTVNVRAASDSTSYSTLVTDQPLRIVLDSIAKLSDCTWKSTEGGYVLRARTKIDPNQKSDNALFSAMSSKQWDLMDDRGYLNWEDLTPNQQKAFDAMATVSRPNGGEARIVMADDFGNKVEIRIGGDSE